MKASRFPLCCAMSCVYDLYGEVPPFIDLNRNFISIHTPAQKEAYDRLAARHTLLSVTKVRGNDSPFLAVCVWRRGKR